MSLKRAKTILSDPLNSPQKISQDFLNLSRNISNKYLNINSLLRIKYNEKIINNGEFDDDIAIVFFDTETTGLSQINKLEVFIDEENKKYEFISYRNQIQEVGAICYNSKLEFESLDESLFFHGKVKDENLDEHNSIHKLGQKFNSYISDRRVKENFIKLQEKNKFNPDYSNFKMLFPKDILTGKNSYESEIIIRNVFKFYVHSAIAEMNHSEKRRYKYIYDSSRTYIVNDNYANEIELIENLFNFILEKKKKYQKVFVAAHNLPYDFGMIRGAILDKIDFYTYLEEDNQKVQYYKDMLEISNQIFEHRIDTVEIFRDILNNKKYGQKIISLYANNKDIKKIKLVRHLAKTLYRKRSSNGKYSAALGNIAPLSLHTDFHTSINDIYVTVESLKLYCSIPSILELIKEEKENLSLPETIKDLRKSINFNDLI